MADMTSGKSWIAFMRRGWAGLLPTRHKDIGYDLVAAFALAAVAIPEQMATARLAGAPAETGLFVFIAGSLGFFLLGSNRYLSVGSDSTIAPIFAGSLITLGAFGTSHYLELVTTLALLVGAFVFAAGVLRMGWIARLLSVPVITGFLAGIAIHITVSQLPALLGIASVQGELLTTVSNLYRNITLINPLTLVIGVTVFAITSIGEKIDIRLPGALIAVIFVTLAVDQFGLIAKGVAVLGDVRVMGSGSAPPHIAFSDIGKLLPLALIISLVVIIQTAVTSRSFPDNADTPNLNRDLMGVGFGNILSGAIGGFPANSSPPRTAIVCESGGKSRFAGFCGVIIVAAFVMLGLSLLAHVPQAALAGLLLFVAQRIFRFSVMKAIATQSPAEFGLLVATAIAIVIAPIGTGVGIGVTLSLLYGVWTIAQTRAIEFENVPGSTVWWPASKQFIGSKRAGIVVVGFQAPLFFLNAEAFRKSLDDAINLSPQPVRAVVLEASSIVELDFSGAQALAALIRCWRDQGVEFYISRLESVRAQRALQKFGISILLGEERIFHSVDDAIRKIESGRNHTS
jgi:SulP family sulfate permease